MENQQAKIIEEMWRYLDTHDCLLKFTMMKIQT